MRNLIVTLDVNRRPLQVISGLCKFKSWAENVIMDSSVLLIMKPRHRVDTLTILTAGLEEFNATLTRQCSRRLCNIGKRVYDKVKLIDSITRFLANLLSENKPWHPDCWIDATIRQELDKTVTGPEYQYSSWHWWFKIFGNLP